jgi:hypothetical protein
MVGMDMAESNFTVAVSWVCGTKAEDGILLL